MTIQLIQFNKTSLPSINDSSLAVSPEGEISYTKEMTPDCWNGDELALFYALAETFNVGCSHFGSVTIQDAEFKSFTYPGVSKNADGVVGLQLGDQWISPLVLGEVEQETKKGVKLVPAWLLAGVRVFFGESSYKNPENPAEDLFSPVLEISSGDLIFQISCQIAQLPYDASKRKEDGNYFDNTAFKKFLNENDEEKVLNFITEKRSGYGKSTSISYFLQRVFEAKAFPPGGIVIPVTGYTKLPSNDPKKGDSMALKIDLENAWFVATGNPVPPFITIVKEKDKDPADCETTEVTGMYVGAKHKAYLNIIALENTIKDLKKSLDLATEEDQKEKLKARLAGLVVSESNPWILKISAPNKNGDFGNVPEHILYTLDVARIIPALKGTFPAQFALSGVFASPVLPPF